MALPKVQRQANDLYNHGRDWARKGEEFLKRGLHEKRVGDFLSARASMRAAIMNYTEAINSYEAALKLLPSKKLQHKIEKKMDGLNACDLACAKNALRHMMPKAEPLMPINSLRGLI